MGPLRKTFDQLWESSGKLPRLLANLRILLPMENSIGSNGIFHWLQWKFPLDPMEISIGSNGIFHWIQWKILQCHWKNSFSAIGRILQCHWKNSFHFKIGRWVESRPGRPGHPKIEFFFFDSQMIGGLFRAQSRVRLAPKTNFSGPAGPDKNLGP